MRALQSYNRYMGRLLTVVLAGMCSLVTASVTVSTLLSGVAVGGVLFITGETAEAQTVRGNTRQSVRSVGRNTRQTARQVARTPANAGRDIARNTRQTGRQVSRNTIQSARQINRRHFYTLPAGYRWVTRGAYRYCFYRNLYYYPYIYGGKTVYIQVDVNSSGEPLPPPPATEVSVEVETN